MPFKYYLQKGSYASKVTTKKAGINIDSLQTIIDSTIQARNFATSGEAFGYEAQYTDSLIKKLPELAKIEVAFTKKSEKTSKVLLLILLPLTAIIIGLLSLGKRRYFFDHLVLSTEINSFYILFSFFYFTIVNNHIL